VGCSSGRAQVYEPASGFGLNILGTTALARSLLDDCSDRGLITLSVDDGQTNTDTSLLLLGDLPVGKWDQRDEQARSAELLPTGTNLTPDPDLPAACQELERAMLVLPSTLGDSEPIASSGHSFSIVGQPLSTQIRSSTESYLSTRKMPRPRMSRRGARSTRTAPRIACSQRTVRPRKPSSRSRAFRWFGQTTCGRIRRRCRSGWVRSRSPCRSSTASTRTYSTVITLW